MSHKVRFIYMDGKDLTVYLKDHEVSKFMESIGKSEVYFDDNAGKGMWIPIERIRYFHVEREADEEESTSYVPHRDAGDPQGEVEVTPEGRADMGEPVCSSEAGGSL